MFAYCGNGAVIASDYTGQAMNSTLVVADIAKQSHQKDDEIAFLEYCSNNNINTYSSDYDCAVAWAKENRPLRNIKNECHIYEAYGHYFYTDVYEGTEDCGFIAANVVVPTICLQAKRYWDSTYRVAAQIHSDTEPPDGLHCDFPSMDENISGGDRLAFHLFKYAEMFIIPYTSCNGEEMIIRITDATTWCAKHPYK